MLSWRTKPAGTNTSHRFVRAERERYATAQQARPIVINNKPRKIFPDAIISGGKIIVAATRIHASGIGPRRSGPGGRKGTRTSSPYDEPLINQKPTVGSREIEAAILEITSKNIEEIPNCDSIEPQIARTTEIGTKTRNRVSKLEEGTRQTASTIDQSNHKPIKEVI
tara:strand:+ start:1505 stop:2005 length:501 start_codon:yes stop_codon:yes gene_type:complete